MFKNTTGLKADEHQDLKVFESNDYSYAKGELMAPIVFSEMADVAREYPIIFPTNNSQLPYALMGLEPNQNAYVRDDGQWMATYIPGYIRRYPFALSEMPASEGQKQGDVRFAIMVDMDAPHLKNPNGHPVFTPDGKMTPHMQERVKLLESMQKALETTKRMVKVLEDSELLVERVIKIQRQGQEPYQMKGLRIVDEKALNQMDGNAFLALRDKGVLPLIYSHLLSWANFRQGPIAGKYPELAAKPGTKNPSFQYESELIDFSQFS